MSESYDCGSGIGWAINYMLLAGIKDVYDDQIVDSRVSERVRVGYLFWPEIKDLACPRGNVANILKVVVEMATAPLEIGWVSQCAKVGILGIHLQCLCEIFIAGREISLHG